MPSRASFQLPPMADEITDLGLQATSTPANIPDNNPMPIPTRATAGWAEEESTGKSGGSGFGTFGLIAAAVVLMVAAYFGATMFMK